MNELRYSVSHDGWFWSVKTPNPYPMTLPDGQVSILDRHIWESGFCRRRKSAERSLARAERRIARRIRKAEQAHS